MRILLLRPGFCVEIRVYPLISHRLWAFCVRLLSHIPRNGDFPFASRLWGFPILQCCRFVIIKNNTRFILVASFYGCVAEYNPQHIYFRVIYDFHCFLQCFLIYLINCHTVRKTCCSVSVTCVMHILPFHCNPIWTDKLFVFLFRTTCWGWANMVYIYII